MSTDLDTFLEDTETRLPDSVLNLGRESIITVAFEDAASVHADALARGLHAVTVNALDGYISSTDHVVTIDILTMPASQACAAVARAALEHTRGLPAGHILEAREHARLADTIEADAVRLLHAGDYATALTSVDPVEGTLARLLEDLAPDRVGVSHGRPNVGQLCGRVLNRLDLVHVARGLARAPRPAGREPAGREPVGR